MSDIPNNQASVIDIMERLLDDIADCDWAIHDESLDVVYCMFCLKEGHAIKDVIHDEGDCIFREVQLFMRSDAIKDYKLFISGLENTIEFLQKELSGKYGLLEKMLKIINGE